MMTKRKKARNGMFDAIPLSTHDYIGRMPGCGCMVAAVVDVPGYPEVAAEGIADFVKSGLIVERIKHEDVKLCECSHPRETAPEAQPKLF